MDNNLRDLIFQAVDETISPSDFEQLQNAIEQNDEVRAEYLRVVSLSVALNEIATDDENDSDHETNYVRLSQAPERASSLRWDLRSPGLLAIVASALMFVSAIAFWFGRSRIPLTETPVTGTQKQDVDEESLLAGHATLRRSVDLQWMGAGTTYREGDVLRNGRLEFSEGVAEIDFFCGATLIVEGPAALELESDWAVTVMRGRLRAHVPPAARGFIVKAADAEIVDLGTEFALEVGSETSRVEVIEGEVELRGGNYDGHHLTTGQHQLLKGVAEAASIEGLSTSDDVQRRRDNAETLRYAKWKQHSHKLRSDSRLLAYYPIAAGQLGRTVANAVAKGSNRDGQLVGPVDQTFGRFGSLSAGLKFDRPGARVRTRIDGDFQAFTFACWVRIDSLEHSYNALFMADGYENGEPHWQIRDDGRLMFSVMVDDSQEVRVSNRFDKKVVKDAGLHRVYYTEPFWDVSKSGQWFHLAAVYDPTGRRVNQFVNGKQVSSEEILDKFHISTLAIGAAEIGNWGQPFRMSPWFAVRNLNGTIDELAIFNAPLSAEQIGTLYERGKPLGY